jgi:hypothetical protein
MQLEAKVNCRVNSGSGGLTRRQGRLAFAILLDSEASFKLTETVARNTQHGSSEKVRAIKSNQIAETL